VKQSLKNLEEILKVTGAGWENVVKVEMYLKNIKDFNASNEVYEKVCTGKIKPARVTVEVSNLPKEALIEISCVAYKN
jgi:2-iminobutanoate/2-iminopropanoate deaminase